jgi:hypothetical protein
MALPEKKPYERLDAYLNRALPGELEAGKSRGKATYDIISEYNKEPEKKVYKSYFLNQGNGGGENVAPTDGLVFALDMGVGNSYPGTGQLFTDVSPNPLADGSMVSPASFEYGDNRFLGFLGGTGSRLQFGSGAKLNYTDTWSYFLYWKPIEGGGYNYTANVFDKSFDQDNIHTLQYDFNTGTGGSIRPINGGSYQGMEGQVAPLSELNSFAFTKNTNGLSDNYKAYKNGVNTFTTTSDFSITANQTGLNFNNNIGRLFRIYNYYIYNRALTPNEVTTLHTYVTSY